MESLDDVGAWRVSFSHSDEDLLEQRKNLQEGLQNNLKVFGMDYSGIESSGSEVKWSEVK